MALPARYEEWPEQAKANYQSLKKLCASLRDYIDVSDVLAQRINTICQKAEHIDPGDGSMFVCAANVIKAKFLTQTFH